MIFLLDTNAVTDLMNDHAVLRARVSGVVPPDRAVICSIIRGEIRFGIDRLPHGRRRHDLDARAAKVFAVVPCESVPAAAGDEYARIKVARKKQGLAFDENDVWIAATASVLGAVLISRDMDFRRTPGLTVEDWTH